MVCRVCLFAHYDPQGAIRPRVAFYLQHLAACGFQLHVALAGVEALTEQHLSFSRETGIALYPRPNQGLDFGSWQFLIQQGCTKGADTILLANDSVFGPFFSLADIFSVMHARHHDVWGMVESYEHSWHLQSWFLHFTAEAFQRPAIQRVMALPFQEMSKDEIILHGEIGLGAAIKVEKLYWGAILRDDKSKLRRRIPTNIMHADWIMALKSGKVPFIKAELLRDNPLQVPSLHLWPHVVRGYPQPWESWIRDYLALSKATAHPPHSYAHIARRVIVYLLLSRDRLYIPALLLRKHLG